MNIKLIENILSLSNFFWIAQSIIILFECPLAAIFLKNIILVFPRFVWHDGMFESDGQKSMGLLDIRVSFTRTDNRKKILVKEKERERASERVGEEKMFVTKLKKGGDTFVLKIIQQLRMSAFFRSDKQSGMDIF